MFLIALAVCVFIRQFLKETMANPAPWPGYREFLGNILPCVPQAATYTQDTSRREGFGFRMLWDGPDGKGDNSPPARERQKMIHAYLATMWVFGIGVRLSIAIPRTATGMYECGAFDGGLRVGAQAGCYSMSANYMMGQLHYQQEDTIPVNFAGWVFAIASGGIGVMLTPRLGAQKTMALGFGLTALAPLMFVTTGEVGPYFEKLCSAIGNTIMWPPLMMYLGAMLQATDLSRAQSAASILQVIPGIFAPGIFTTLFYGDKTHMDVGYVVGSILLFANVLVALLMFPKNLPKKAPPKGDIKMDKMEVVDGPP